MNNILCPFKQNILFSSIKQAKDENRAQWRLRKARQARVQRSNLSKEYAQLRQKYKNEQRTKHNYERQIIYLKTLLESSIKREQLLTSKCSTLERVMDVLLDRTK